MDVGDVIKTGLDNDEQVEGVLLLSKKQGEKAQKNLETKWIRGKCRGLYCDFRMFDNSYEHMKYQMIGANIDIQKGVLDIR